MNVTSPLLSPTESCVTFQNNAAYNHKLVDHYFQSRLEANNSYNLTILHNEHSFEINLALVLNLINTFSLTKVALENISINHLLLYIYYYQHQLLGGHEDHYINQFCLLYSGKSFKIAPPKQPGSTDKDATDYLIVDHYDKSHTFHLLVQTTSTLSIYKYFNLENYLNNANPVKSVGYFAKILASRTKEMVPNDSTMDKHRRRRRSSIKRLLFS